MQLQRTRFGKDIVCEVARPPRASHKALLLIGGLPSLPSKPQLLEYYANKGYWVFMPRIRGTWESGGEFLQYSPEVDHQIVINGIIKGWRVVWTGEKFVLKPKHIDVIGGSFGGTAAVLLSALTEVRKIVAFAPVIDWTVESKGEPHVKFKSFIREAYGMAYRGDSKNLDKLFKGEIYDPATASGLVGKKMLIVHAKDDEIVPYEPVVGFADKHSAKLVLREKGGHFGLSSAGKGRNRTLVEQFLNIR